MNIQRESEGVLIMRVIEPVHPELKVIGSFPAILIDPVRRVIEDVALPLYETDPTSDMKAASGHEGFKLVGLCTTSQMRWFPNGDTVDIEDLVGPEESRSRASFKLHGRRCFSSALVNGWDETHPLYPIVAPKSTVDELRALVKWVAPETEQRSLEA
jgi:hypothetical protein